MGTGRPDDVDPAAYALPAGSSALPSSLGAAARRPGYFDRAIVLDAGGGNVVVVLGDGAGDPDAIWDFIRERMTGRNTGPM